MGNVCGAFWPIAKRHMAQQPSVNVSIRPFKRLNAAGRPVLGSEVCFRVSPTSPLHDLFDFYASMTRDIPLSLLHFRSLSDGTVVRGDHGKASALAAAYAADVALSRHGPDFSPYLCSQDGFQETAERLEELIQLENRVEDYWSRVDSADGDLLLVEEASQFPGKFY